MELISSFCRTSSLIPHPRRDQQLQLIILCIAAYALSAVSS
uniref:Uncharacterized protein n=1 Tax=Picea glauca TaxID=3330 RepID=A0A101LZS0_PICGL|nr:hypothetical protein ABT39_MTgene5340 [Picea glauca]QHR88921.1 hypothetical protein Q903MT_gene2940 [Picea sitchensis]